MCHYYTSWTDAIKYKVKNRKYIKKKGYTGKVFKNRNYSLMDEMIHKHMDYTCSAKIRVIWDNQHIPIPIAMPNSTSTVLLLEGENL